MIVQIIQEVCFRFLLILGVIRDLFNDVHVLFITASVSLFSITYI